MNKCAAGLQSRSLVEFNGKCYLVVGFCEMAPLPGHDMCPVLFRNTEYPYETLLVHKDYLGGMNNLSEIQLDQFRELEAKIGREVKKHRDHVAALEKKAAIVRDQA
ncbi:MAG: hypothetical protein Q8O93_05940 [bacterium]|nr:hypothetical protein [bacterium]